MGLRVGEFERSGLFQMFLQEPGVVDQALEDQGFASGKRRALAAHDRTRRELGTCRLIGTGGERLARHRLPAKRGEGWPSIPAATGRKAAECFAAEAPGATSEAGALGCKGARDALRQILAIVAAHDLVADGIGELADPRFQS